MALMISTRSSFRSVVFQDLLAMVEPPPGRPTARWWLEVSAKLVLVPRLRAVVSFRVSRLLATHGMMAAALWLHGRTVRNAGAEISPLASIGPGLCLRHSVGVVIGPQVTIGERVTIHQGVTLGDGRRPGGPRLGDDVTIGVGACVLGGVRVGNRVIIGAHAVVTRDLPDDVVAVGAPATGRPRRPDQG